MGEFETTGAWIEEALKGSGEVEEEEKGVEGEGVERKKDAVLVHW